jgi:hypothetical protein
MNDAPQAVIVHEGQPETMISAIIALAKDPAVDVTKLDALLRMQERMQERQAEREFAEAMARLQPKLPRITKSKEVRYPVDKNKPDGPTKHAFWYSPIEKIDDAIRPLLNEEGFSLSADTETLADGKIVVVGKLTHRGGHTKISRSPPLPFDTSGGKNNAQAGVSSFSYGYRLCQRALLNLVFEGEDDDGEAAGREYITAEQVKEISDLLMETKTGIEGFCTMMGVEALPDIQKPAFAVAMNLLNARKNKRGAPRESA